MEAEARAMEELKMAAENSKLQMQANVKAQYESELSWLRAMARTHLS